MNDLDHLSFSEARDILPKIKRFHKEYIAPTQQSELACAASLAHHGFIGSVSNLCLRDVNLSFVPVAHLASLASCVTWRVSIRYVSGIDLSPILDSLKCDVLGISNQSLSTEESQALVRALETGVGEVVLGDYGDVTLDIEVLAGYSRQGKCSSVSFHRDTAARYREDLRLWDKISRQKSQCKLIVHSLS